MALEPIVEREFYDFSYGFRPGKSAHQALERLWKEIMNMNGGYVIDMDISKCFDTIDHGHLREMVSRRVSDGVITRVIGKWLNAGVMDGDKREYPGKGTPQGGVISPLLSNLFLHEVLVKVVGWLRRQVLRGFSGHIAFVPLCRLYTLSLAIKQG